MVPMACLIPKKKNLILLMGRNRGTFFGNIKYFLLYLHRCETNDIKYYFFTQDKLVYKTLRQNNLPAIYHPTFLSIYALLRSKVIIADDLAWRKKYKYYLSFKSKKIQSWHGISLKKIALTIPSVAEYHKTVKGKLDDAITGRYQMNDLFISTSEFYTENVFSKSFRAKCFFEAGYPRNDVLFNNQCDKYELLGADQKAISKINELRANGYKIILYAPTFKDITKDAVANGVLKLNELSEFARKHKMTFVFKFHSAAVRRYDLGAYGNIIEYDKSKDVQPILRMTDILITDYSSIYMDYLLLDKPVIFLPYDRQTYTEKDKGLLFDYDWITPGPKCYSQDELQKALIEYIVKQKDDFSEKREKIRNLAFKYKDGKASERMWNFIRERYLI
jgi:CDP-glycerol glycerophosphotransferase (TagB/SpsB family)